MGGPRKIYLPVPDCHFATVADASWVARVEGLGIRALGLGFRG